MVVTKLADKIQVHKAKVKVVLRTPHRCYVFGMGEWNIPSSRNKIESYINNNSLSSGLF